MSPDTTFRYNKHMGDFFSVIIPSLNEESHLPRLLENLSRQTDKDFEIIVNDSGSTDRTKELSYQAMDGFNSFRFLEKKSKNVSAARNGGAKESRGNWLIFFDSDVQVEERFIEKIRIIITKHPLDVCTVWNRPHTKNLKGIIALTVVNVAMSLFQKIAPAANGPCIIIKKDVFEKLNGFDEEIVFGEDFNLIQRAHRLGARFAVFRDPVLYVSARRFEKEGLILSGYKSLKALLYQLFIGPIKKPIFEYKMGGENFKE